MNEPREDGVGMRDHPVIRLIRAAGAVPGAAFLVACAFSAFLEGRHRLH